MTSSHPSPTTATAADPTADPTANLVVLRGVVTADPVERTLAGGGAVVQFDLRTVEGAAGGATVRSVPVAWHDPSARQRPLVEEGSELVVVGTVNRRFFRAGGRTQSRTEVIVDRIVPVRRRTTVAALLTAVAAELTRGCGRRDP